MVTSKNYKYFKELKKYSSVNFEKYKHFDQFIVKRYTKLI